MSIKTDLRTLLKAQISITNTLFSSTSVYVVKVPQGSELPHIVLTRGSTDFLPTLDATSGLQFEAVDIDCKARNQEDAEDTADAVKTFIDDYTGTAGNSTIRAIVMQDQSDDYVADGEGKDTGVHWETLDVMVQSE